MLLCLLNNLVSAHDSVQNLKWEREANRGVELKGKTIGIIGFGHTGSSFAKKWEGWNVNVLAYDKYKKNYADNLDFVKETNFSDVLKNSDVLSLHLPLSAETNKLVNIDFISEMKEGAILINTSRGKIVETRDVYDSLLNKRLSGACLDVLENEKMNNLSQTEKSFVQRLICP